MPELRDVCERPTIYSRAEPDDEYDRLPNPMDPSLTDEGEYEIDDEDELDEDDYSN
jgi:hypothetical protein